MMEKPFARGSAAVLAVLGGLSPLSASGQSATPVFVGGTAEFDACLGLGQVVGLDPAGDNFLAVRSGPGAKNAETDRLGPERFVTVCDKRGAWLGVVYAPDGADTDCGTSSPQAVRAPYHGPCGSGWVHRSHVEIVAG